MPNLKVVLQQLRSKRADLESNMKQIDIALTALGSLNGARRKGKRNLSAAARNRIAAAQRARWAKWKRAHTKAA
jgi:hypothetical protein